MQNRIESHSLRWFDELATTQFKQVDRDDTVPWTLYSQPYERIEIAVPQPAVSISANQNLVAEGDDGFVAQPLHATAAYRRQRRLATRVVSPWAMLLAGIAGASAFVLGVAIVELLS